MKQFFLYVATCGIVMMASMAIALSREEFTTNQQNTFIRLGLITIVAALLSIATKEDF